MRQTITFLSFYSAFITIGLISNTAGPLVPFFKTHFNCNDVQAGMLISANFTGMIVSVMFGGILADKIGKRKFLIAGSFLIVLAMISAVFSANYTALLASFLISGCGFGMYEIGINSYASDYCRAKGIHAESRLNIVHFFFGIGAISAPLIIKVTQVLSYTFIFWIIILFALASGILLIFAEEVSYKHSEKSIFDLLKSAVSVKIVWLTGLMALFYVGIEVGSGGWLPEFWRQSFENTLLAPAYSASLFWTSLTFGRLFSAWVSAKLGYAKYLLTSCSVLVVLFSAWILLPSEPLLIGIVAGLGLTLSGLFPAIISISLKNHSGISATITSIVIIFTALGGSLGPAVTGFAVQHSSVNSVPMCMLVSALFFLVITILMIRKSKQEA